MIATPDLPLVDFGLRVQPMVHVGNLAAGIGFYEALGGQLLFGSRDGDWALIHFGDTALSLLAHEPSDEIPEQVELHFASDAPLDALEAHLMKTAPQLVDQGIGDEAFGRMLKLRTPDGLLVKVLEIERELIS